MEHTKDKHRRFKISTAPTNTQKQTLMSQRALDSPEGVYTTAPGPHAAHILSVSMLSDQSRLKLLD